MAEETKVKEAKIGLMEVEVIVDGVKTNIVMKDFELFPDRIINLMTVIILRKKWWDKKFPEEPNFHCHGTVGVINTRNGRLMARGTELSYGL